jgi:hypothetical protein
MLVEFDGACAPGNEAACATLLEMNDVEPGSVRARRGR